MAKNKLKKFNQLKIFSNVIEPSLKDLEDGFNLKGKWKKNFFKNNNPIVLELGCGKGEYSVGLSKRYTDKNFIGIDIKGARIWKGANDAIKEKIENVAFLRTRIDWIEKCFSEDEVDEIWITFPDPQLKKRRAKKRLTHPLFLDKYAKIMKKNGLIHLKTDSQFLHGFTLGVIASRGNQLHESTHNLYQSKVSIKNSDIKTHYEQIFLDKNIPITYLCFSF